MIMVGFTGTRRGMTGNQCAALDRLLIELASREPFRYFHHGLCVGGDEQAADIARALGYRIVAHPGRPEGDDARAQAAPGDHVMPVPDGPNPEIKRNHKIVDVSEVMVSAPFGFKEMMRSGTWATMRYTRTSGVPLHVVWPDGDVSRSEDYVDA